MNNNGFSSQPPTPVPTSFSPEIESLLQALATHLAEPKLEIKVYSIKEVASILGVKERTVKHHLHEAKDLRYLTLGREIKIRHEDLKEFLERRLRPILQDHNILPR